MRKLRETPENSIDVSLTALGFAGHVNTLSARTAGVRASAATSDVDVQTSRAAMSSTQTVP